MEKCVICGKEFIPRKSGRKQICCSKECLDVRRANYVKAHPPVINYSRAARIQRKARKRATASAIELTKLQQAAADQNMSYGQYIAANWIKERG